MPPSQPLPDPLRGPYAAASAYAADAGAAAALAAGAAAAGAAAAGGTSCNTGSEAKHHIDRRSTGKSIIG